MVVLVLVVLVLFGVLWLLHIPEMELRGADLTCRVVRNPFAGTSPCPMASETTLLKEGPKSCEAPAQAPEAAIKRRVSTTGVLQLLFSLSRLSFKFRGSLRFSEIHHSFDGQSW